VELVAHRADGPYAGVHRMTALEFIARWVDHVPEHYEVLVRYAGAYHGAGGGASDPGVSGMARGRRAGPPVGEREGAVSVAGSARTGVPSAARAWKFLSGS
jgi:hypothetical protein